MQRGSAKQLDDSLSPRDGGGVAGDREGRPGKDVDAGLGSRQGLKRMQHAAGDAGSRQGFESLRSTRAASVQSHARNRARLRQRPRDALYRGVTDRDQDAARPLGELSWRNGGGADELGCPSGVLAAPPGHGHYRLAAFAKQAAKSLRHTAGPRDPDRCLGVRVHVRNNTDSFEKTHTAAKNAKPA